jgi:signal transduction histidine kinase/ligand-binding sensor domain-containing protein
MFDKFPLFRAAVGLSLALTISTRAARALDPNQRTTSYIRTIFTVENGLSSNVVNSILQTRNGFLWIGTDAGLNRFDGRHFSPIYFRGPESTPQGIVSRLAEAPNGDLWVGTNAGLLRIARPGLDEFDRSLSTMYHPGTGISDEITSLRFSRSGTLWVGTAAGLYRFQGNRFETVIPRVSISRIEENADGHMLVITSLGFIELDGSRIVEHPGLADQLGIRADSFFHVYQDRRNAVWFSTRYGLARRANGSIERFGPYGIQGDDGVFQVHEDPQGTVWVSRSSGLFRVSGKSLEPLAPGIPTRDIESDREGDLWVGTNGQGLIRFKDRPIRMFGMADGLPNNIPMTVLSKRDGALWVGNNCGGLSVFEGERFHTYNEKDGLSNSCVWSLAEGKSGELWVGTWFGGLFRFADGHFTHFGPQQGLAGEIVRAIAVAGDGSLWIATEGGLSHMLNGQFRNYTTNDGLSSNRVVSVYIDRRGGIWTGTSRGVNRMSGERFVPILAADEIFDPRYISLGEDSAGDLYALSAPKGVDRIEGNRLARVNHELDLLSMATPRPGELWFSGGNGIFRFSADAFRRQQVGQDAPPDYAWFGRTDGMTSTQSSIGSPNMAVTADHKLWVCTVQGLAMLDLPHLSWDAARPRIFIEGVTIGRERRPAGHELLLPPGTHHVELRFDSIALASPEKIRFQYRMDGIDPVWLEADDSLTAVYTNIPIGAHAFKVRASNGDGVWDLSGISFLVEQKPWFYETGWFRLLVALAFVLTFTGAWRLRLRQVRTQMNARLDERVLERTRIARDLHDTLLQSFQALLLNFHSVTYLLPNRPSEARDALQTTIEHARQAIIEGRHAVEGLRSSSYEGGDLQATVGKLGRELAASYSGPSSPDFHVNVRGATRSLTPMVGNEIGRVAIEAVRNAFQHSQARRIEVEICYHPRQLQLRVRDNGKGIDPKVFEAGRIGHYGIPGMRERTRLAGGKLVLRSELDSGTELTLTIPASLAYARESDSKSPTLVARIRRILS